MTTTSIAPTRTSPAPRVALFGIEINALTMRQAVERIYEWVRTPGVGCRYVVTPNIDHVVVLQQHAGLRAAYASASLVLPDGFPVVWASRLVGRPLPELVPGSDLVPAIFDAAAAHAGLRVFLLGAAPGVADEAAERIGQRWPGVQVVGTYSPPLGFEHDAAENMRIIGRINATEADLLILGLGAPKQELWIAQHAHELEVSGALCVGATIDFLAGEKSRAPAWMRRCRLEWLHRLASEPRRLAGRYARDAWVFPQLVWRQWRQQEDPNC
jgi:N-acetylglucosaminyldiphosphoundecaprenol N-acetyl-beta-D-mannosaminyltransferase